MKKIIAILSFTLLLVSCGGNTSTSSQTEWETTLNSASTLSCEDQAQAAGEKLVAANENPDVSLEFLGSAEGNNNCYLKVKITQQVGVETAEVYTLFDTATEQSYNNYTDLKQMELALIELKK